jgi:hypothetical protein
MDQEFLNPPPINGFYLDVFSNVGLIEDEETQKFIVDKASLNEKDVSLYFEKRIRKPFSLKWKTYLKLDKNGYYSFNGYGKNGGYIIKSLFRINFFCHLK